MDAGAGPPGSPGEEAAAAGAGASSSGLARLQSALQQLPGLGPHGLVINLSSALQLQEEGQPLQQHLAADGDGAGAGAPPAAELAPAAVEQRQASSLVAGPVTSLLRTLSAAAIAPASSPAAAAGAAAPDELGSHAGALSAVPQPLLDESPAEAAARHRLASTQPLDLQFASKYLEGLLPYLLIFMAAFVWHFFLNIFLSLWLLCSLVKANGLVRGVVAASSPKGGDGHAARRIAAALLYVAVNTALVLWLGSGRELHWTLLLLPPAAPLTFWRAVFTVVVADSLARFCGLAPKLLAVAALRCRGWREDVGAAAGAPPVGRGARRQARVLTLLEHLVATYRLLVPGPVWLSYLLGCTGSAALGSLLALLYCAAKSYSLLQQLRLVSAAAAAALRSGPAHGAYLGKAESADACCCPICQEPAAAPVRLDCSHVFCDDCIAEWLERNKTCPMCRSAVQPPGLTSFADGATSLLPQLF